MTRTGYFARLGISIVIDLLDLTILRLPVMGTITDGVGTVALVAMWGPAGLIYLFELVDVTDQIDAFVPTATMVALFVGWREGFLGRGGKRSGGAIPARPE
jgi:hypothetical protein